MTLDAQTFARREQLFQRTFPVAASDMSRRGRGFQVEHLRLTADVLKSNDPLVAELGAGKPVDKFVELVESLKAKNKKFDDEQDEDRQATEVANKARADLDRQRRYYNRAVENLCERNGIPERLPQYLSSYGPKSRTAGAAENPGTPGEEAEFLPDNDAAPVQGEDSHS